MKKLLSLFTFLFVALMAQAELSFSIDNVNIKAGEEKTLSVVLTNDQEAKSAAIDISLPAGLSFVGTNGSVEYSDRVSGMMLKSAKIQSSGALRVGLSLGTTIEVGTGEVFTFKVKADENVTLGLVKMSFTGMSITNTSNVKVTIPDAQIDVNIYKLVNISVAPDNNEKGIVSGGNNEAMYGSQATVTATANEGYHFVNWTSGETAVSTDNPYVFTVTNDINLVANFAPNQYTMTFVLDNNEDNVVKTQDYNSTLEAPTPTKNGYTFKGWNPEVPATVPAENMTFTAQWEAELLGPDWTSSEVGAGEFYLYNVGAKGFLVGANDWGTQASIDATGGIPVTLAANDGAYTISTSPTYNGKFLGVDGYVDQASVSWVFEAVKGQDKVYKMKVDSKYLYAEAVADAGLLAKTTKLGADPGTSMSYWKLISKENMFADFESASESSPIWVSSLIKNPGFGRNITAGWGWSVDAGNQSMSGGTNENRCAEHWRSAFTVKQTISDVPNGKYRLRVQAALTDYAGAYDGANYPVAYIKSGETESTAPFNNMDESDRGTDMATLSNSFSAGKYFTNYMVVTVTNGQIEIGVRGTRTDTWCIYDNFQLSYLGEDLSAYVDAYHNALTAANGVDQSAPMHSTVLSALQTAISEYSSVSETDKNTLLAGANALSTAAGNANTSIANYAEAKDILDAANGYDDVGQASYAADETIVAIKTAYDDFTLTAVTDEQKTSAHAALVTACKAQAQPVDGCDMTVVIQNWDFLNCAKDNFPGWTIEKTAGNAQAFGNTAAEYWVSSAVNGGFDFYQSVTDLPTGAYTVQALMWNSTDNADGEVNGECGVYGKSSSADEFAGVTVDTRDGGKAIYATTEIVVIDGTLRLGVKNNATMGARWFGVDWIKLTYARQLNAEEEEAIEKATAQKKYNEALTAAEAIAEGTITTSAYENLQNTVNNNTVTDGTTSAYNDAADAINEAVTAAQTLLAPYAAWKAMKALADALVAVANDNNFANGTLATAISEQNTAVEATTAIAAIETATVTLKEDMVTYAGDANPVGDGAQFDLTFMLTNPDVTKFWDGTWWIQPEGWYKDQTDGNFQVMNNGSVNAEDGIHTVFMEYYYLNNNRTYDNGLFNIYTKATLPKGTYTMSCYAFAKEENYSSGAANPQVYFYANDTQGSLVSSNKLTEQSISFVNESEQEVKIGLKPLAGNTCNWMGIGYVNLYKVPAKTIEISEDVDYTPESVAGKVTLKRILSTDKWNTFVVPFQITNSELKTAFGKDVEVAEWSEVPNGEVSGSSTIEFNLMDIPAITPNKPVLLKPSETNVDNTYEFEDRTISTSDPVISGENYDFVGTYTALITLKEGDYFIGNNKLWEADPDPEKPTTIKGTRAYLRAKTPEARITDFRIGESESTGIVSIDNRVKSIDNATFDLQGRKVTNVKKGLYIKNSKKVVVR